jgi:hypothetical protein
MTQARESSVVVAPSVPERHPHVGCRTRTDPDLDCRRALQDTQLERLRRAQMMCGGQTGNREARQKKLGHLYWLNAA